MRKVWATFVGSDSATLPAASLEPVTAPPTSSTFAPGNTAPDTSSTVPATPTAAPGDTVRLETVMVFATLLLEPLGSVTVKRTSKLPAAMKMCATLLEPPRPPSPNAHV